MSELTPKISDIRLSYEMLGDDRVVILSDQAHRSLFQLVRFCASALVWTYSPPGDGSLPDDDVALSRLTGLSVRAWRKVRSEIEPFFIVRGGRWHLNEPWIEIGSGGRPAIPLAIAAKVAEREGKKCTYCGATDVPLHLDHIFPLSRGGSNDASNLTLAYGPCNLSKGSKTLKEWKS